MCACAGNTCTLLGCTVCVCADYLCRKCTWGVYTHAPLQEVHMVCVCTQSILVGSAHGVCVQCILAGSEQGVCIQGMLVGRVHGVCIHMHLCGKCTWCVYTVYPCRKYTQCACLHLCKVHPCRKCAGLEQHTAGKPGRGPPSSVQHSPSSLQGPCSSLVGPLKPWPGKHMQPLSSWRGLCDLGQTISSPSTPVFCSAR